MNDDIRIRKMTTDDIRAVVKIHVKSFSGSFLEEMGELFLFKYYDLVLKFSNSINIVIENESGKIQGFVVGFLNPIKFYKYFKANRLQLIPSILLALIRRPFLLKRIINNTSRVTELSSNQSSEIICELSSIAINSDAIGKGSRLIRSFINESWKNGANKIVLTTDENKNDHVIKFYLKHGFLDSGREIRDNRRLIIFTLKKI